MALPDSILTESRRVSYVIFQDGRVFGYKKDLQSVNSKVISINVDNYTHFEEGEVSIFTLFLGLKKANEQESYLIICDQRHLRSLVTLYEIIVGP